MSNQRPEDISQYNRGAWNHYVSKGNRWTIPVSEHELSQINDENWSVVLTPCKPVPHSWFPHLKGLKILGLASGGGQQGPILAKLGADVCIFDNSDAQLQRDKEVSDKHQLGIKTVQGDMKDLSCFEDGSFDLIFNPCSVGFVEHLQPVWNECFRVLRKGGVLMTGLINPILWQIDEKKLNFRFKRPYTDFESLPPEEFQKLVDDQEAFVFGHSTEDQIGGILKAGFLIDGYFEDIQGGDNKIDEFFAGFFAVRAIKP